MCLYSASENTWIANAATGVRSYSRESSGIPVENSPDSFANPDGQTGKQPGAVRRFAETLTGKKNMQNRAAKSSPELRSETDNPIIAFGHRM